MPNLYFDGKYSNRIHKFVQEKYDDTDKTVFETLYHFMVFLAMIGRNNHQNCNNIEIKDRTNEILDSRFVQNDLDGIAYLLAIENAQDGNILREGNEKQLWKYLENFAALGMEELDTWLEESPSLDPRDVVLSKMQEIALDDITPDNDEKLKPIW